VVLAHEDHGYIVRDDDDDPELLIHPGGEVVDTWRENYPYDHRMSRDEYEEQKRLLQIELLKLQKWRSAPASTPCDTC
jgi:polyphosphate kinase